MTDYLIVQIILTSIDRPNNYTQVNNWNNIIRVVPAKTKEEALGRFVIETQNITAVERLNPEVNILNDIITL